MEKPMILKDKVTVRQLDRTVAREVAIRCGTCLVVVLLTGCAIPLPYQYDQSIIDGLDAARLETKTICREITNDNEAVLSARYTKLIASVETIMENARSRPRRHGWIDRMMLRVSRKAPESTPSQSNVDQPKNILSCKTPGAKEGWVVTGSSVESLQLAQATLERLQWCHQHNFDPEKKQVTLSVRELRRSELCDTVNDYIGDARLFEKTLKIE